MPQKLHLKFVLWLVFMVGLSTGGLEVNSAAMACDDTTYEIGVGKADITGPLIPVGMMGYAEFSQKVTGIHMPLLSRALFVQDHCGGLPIVMAINDMGMVFGSLRESVLKGVNERLPGVFDQNRFLLSATHTHAGIGGISDRVLYNITTGGRHQETIDAIVAGTVEAIIQAYQSRETGTLHLQKGDSTEDLQFNRSLEAYEKNPSWEKSMYTTPYDPSMVMLVAKDLNHEAIGAFNWFGVHPVSLSIENRLVSGDNKGLAAYWVEQSINNKPRQRQSPFVAGFVQSKAGDISPYGLDINSWNSSPKDHGWSRNLTHGHSQFRLAMQLLEQPGSNVAGPAQGLITTQNLAHAAFSFNGNSFRTCGGVLGVSFAGGTENARPFPIFKEGTIYGVNWPRITLMPKEQHCHKNKVILLPTGFLKPQSWTANEAPFQLIRLGSLLIAALPFEVTTMAGRRIERMLLQATEPFGIQQVVLSTLANEYLHYATTLEEYSSQQYEGGSNLFGPQSLEAYLSIYSSLATRLIFGTGVTGPKSFQDLSAKPTLKPFATSRASVTKTGKLHSQPSLGKVIQDASQPIKIGEIQEVTWIGAPWKQLDHKHLNLTGTVEEWQENRWVTIAGLFDPYTTMEAIPRGFGVTHMKMTWAPPILGHFRLCYQGLGPSSFLSLPFHKNPAQSCSKGFDVQP